MASNSMEIKESIRLRPGMYIGDLRFRGFLTMLESLFDEIIELIHEDAEMQFYFNEGNTINITFNKVKTIQFEEYIKFIETRKNPISFGLNVIVALSSTIEISVNNGESSTSLIAKHGDYKVSTFANDKQKDTAHINFTPDKTILKLEELSYEYCSEFLKKFAFLNPGLKIETKDNRAVYQHNVFHYPLGVKHVLDKFMSTGDFYSKPEFRLDLQKTIGEYSYQFSFCYHYMYCQKSYILSFANNKQTLLGGSLVNGIIEGIIKAIKDSAGETPINISKKLAKENLILIAAVKGKDFNYKGATKWELDEPKIKMEIKDYTYEVLLSNFSNNQKMKENFITQFMKFEDD